MTMHPRVFFLPLFALLGLTGCAFGPVSTGPTPMAGAALQGIVHGGQQPIVGAHVYLFAAGTGGYGGNGIAASSANSSISLLNSNVVTNNAGNYGFDGTNYYVITRSDGSFGISGDYTCTTGAQPYLDQQLYLYVVGGNPGAGTNSASGLLAAIGACSSINSGTYIWVNEVSTIATAYALAGFATDATHISSSGTALAQRGIYNAFNNVTNLETLGSGVALATTPAQQGANGTVPQKEINSLGNILAACVNSTGPSSTACTTLLQTATSTGIPIGTSGAGTEATDTATAAIYIAQHPGANVSTLYNIPPPTAAFSPVLSSIPNDFTIMLAFTGGGMSNPQSGLAIDATGNVWVSNNNQSGSNNNGAPYLSEFSAIGTPLSGSTGYAIPSYAGFGGLLSIDPSGNTWFADYRTIFEVNGSGTVTQSFPSPSTYGGIAAIANDSLGNIWVIQPNNSGQTALFKLNTAGSNLSGAAGYTGGDLGGGTLAFDGSGNIWAGYGALSKFSSSGTAISPSTGYTGGGQHLALTLAIDHSGNIWTSDSQADSDDISEFNNSGTPLSGSSGYTTTTFGMNQTLSGIAVDGAGNIWVNGTAGGEADTIYALYVFNSSGNLVNGEAPAHSGYQGGSIYGGPMAIDGSGDVWNVNSSRNTLTEVIGAATPVVTPLAANLVSPYSAPASKP